MKNLYLIEFYTVSDKGVTGWDINFAWVYAANDCEAVRKLRTNQGKRFDCVVTISEQVEIRELAGDFRVNTPDANLFIIQ